MSPTRGAQRRPANAAAVLLQGRVSPEVREAIHAAAKASGTSTSYYLDRYFKDLLDELGTLPVVHPPRPQKETLDVDA
ncbi:MULTISPECIES: hypothetical protein [Bacteria]|uniref:hypothetical protein n=1 Tax=Bacteria TaxID=2 RepID=UPI003C7E367B